jgi:4-hydroxybenzoate polyprenyltransferase
LNKISAFLQLIRWQNLLFVLLTQILVRYCIIRPILINNHAQFNISLPYFLLLLLSSILIAGGGNIINDYFDQNIDQINKPHKTIVGKFINRGWVLLWHLLFSLCGILFGFYISLKIGLHWIAPMNLLCVLLLFIYSISLKRKFLVGNLLIALLSSWVVFIISLAELRTNYNLGISTIINQKIFKLSVTYGGFAFIISLIREVIKDLEDVAGDRKFGCTTMPIVWGQNSTKVFVAVWLIVLIASTLIINIYITSFGWWLSAVYALLFVVAPLIWIFKILMKASTTQDFHKLSSYVKWIMLTGILSMLFFTSYKM